MAVVIETTIGDFVVDLYTEERPQTCRNFLKLCKIKYYNWNLFHTVQSNFIAQTGDPTGTGKGGESIYGKVLGEKARYYEAEQMPKIKHDRVGLLSMVNCGDNMLGSQFFITLAPELRSLDGEHCVFGEIAEGLEIILKFNETICDNDHRPYQDIRISHTVILEDPYDDPKGLIIPDRSPEPTKEALMSDRIGADEEIDDTAGMSKEEVIEMQKEKEAKARATILEIVGDIPDADMAPPENVLFVCKLNPVTTDDDLEIIFSRFGKIIGCEVIRDRQTGDSLQYAFIEFADRESCEKAYFKMDNVLIDDRRIHVDFSQSVAKIRWRGKGKGIQYLDGENDDKITKDKHDSKDRRRDRDHKDNEKEDRKKYNKLHEDTSEHRKYERRKDYEKDNSDRYRNDDKSSFHKDRYRDQKKLNDIHERRAHEDKRDRDRRNNDRNIDKDYGRNRNRSRDRYIDRSRDRERSNDRGKDRNRERSRERDREKSRRNDKIERSNYKDSRYDKKHSTEMKKRQKKEYSPDEEIERNGKYREKHSDHKSKRVRDRSEERQEKYSKHKRKR